MSRIIERIVEALMLVTVVWLLAGCHTIDGLAKDVSWTACQVDKAIVVEDK